MQRLVTTVLILSLVPAVAGAASRDWVPSAAQGALKDCVDHNSIVKRADGYTQYDELLLCTKKSMTSDDAVWVQAVRCDEDMSGATFAMRTRPLVPIDPAMDGAHSWTDNPQVKSASLVGQSAKFVCGK
jgi:hypothetical protein